MLRETSRSILHGALRLTARGYTDPLTPIDELEGLNYLLLINDTAVKGIKANLKLNKIRFMNCEEQNPCNADIRIKATFFNAGTPAEGDMTGDVAGMIYLRSYSNRSKTVDIRGVVTRCLNSDCSSSDEPFDEVLDAVSIRNPINLGVEWDKANQQIVFSYGLKQTAYSYKDTLSDQNVGGTSKDVNARLIIPNTNAQASSMAFVDALIRNVYLKY